jgi:hypothetical protein
MVEAAPDDGRGESRHREWMVGDSGVSPLAIQLSAPFRKFANVSGNRLLTGTAPIKAATVK